MIHGGCEGADCIAHHVAIEFGMRILGETYFGDLGRHGGPARNDLLIDLALVYVAHGYTVCVEAFPSSTARGTWDTVNKARNAGLPYEVTRK